MLLIGTGSEVNLCMSARDRLLTFGIRSRVVSTPSWEVFHEQTREYRESVYSKCQKRITVEAASTLGWERFAGLDGVMIGIDSFGASAPAEQLMTKFGFTVENICAAALRLMGREEEADRQRSLRR